MLKIKDWVLHERWFLLAIVGMFFFGKLLVSAGAAETGADRNYTRGDPARAEWFRSLMQPDNAPGINIPCCDISDCHQTQARQDTETGAWSAIILGEWREIEEKDIVKDPKSIDGEAYVCHSESGETIYCFIPPIPLF